MSNRLFKTNCIIKIFNVCKKQLDNTNMINKKKKKK